MGARYKLKYLCDQQCCDQQCERY